MSEPAAAAAATDSASAASLDNLRDIIVPSGVPWWPPEPAWWVLLIVLVVATLWFIRRRQVARAAIAYRRAALEELRALRDAFHKAEAESESPGATASNVLTPLPGLLKRVALEGQPRDQVARLSGSAWLDFLDRTAGADGFSSAAGIALLDLAYAKPGSVSNERALGALDAAEGWIRAQGPRIDPEPEARP